MRTIPQSIPIAAERGLFFTAVDETDLQVRLDGLSGFTVRIVKPDGTEAVGGGADPSEVHAANEPGVYLYVASVAEIVTPGGYIAHFTKAGMEPREVPFQVTRAVFGTAVTGALAASSFTTNLTTATANHWQRCFLRWLTGNLTGQVGKIGSYMVSGGRITMASGHTFTGAPADGDVFEIING